MTTAEEFITDLIDILDEGINLVDELVTELTKSNSEDDEYVFDGEKDYDDGTEGTELSESSSERAETVHAFVEDAWL